VQDTSERKSDRKTLPTGDVKRLDEEALKSKGTHGVQRLYRPHGRLCLVLG